MVKTSTVQTPLSPPLLSTSASTLSPAPTPCRTSSSSKVTAAAPSSSKVTAAAPYPAPTTAAAPYPVPTTAAAPYPAPTTAAAHNLDLPPKGPPVHRNHRLIEAATRGTSALSGSNQVSYRPAPPSSIFSHVNNSGLPSKAHPVYGNQKAEAAPYPKSSVSSARTLSRLGRRRPPSVTDLSCPVCYGGFLEESNASFPPLRRPASPTCDSPLSAKCVASLAIPPPTVIATALPPILHLQRLVQHLLPNGLSILEHPTVSPRIWRIFPFTPSTLGLMKSA